MRNGYLKNKGIAWIPLLLVGVAAGGILWYWFRGGLVGVALDILNFIAYIVLPITDFFFRTLSQLAATIINVFISLNPFADYGAASILWEFFKNIAYVVIVFLALIAGFEWILNREDAARRLLLGLLLIAFLINFTFILAREIFMAIWYLQIGILQSANLGGEKDSQFGSLLYAALSIVPPTEVANKIVNELSPRIAQQAQEQGAGAGSVHNIQVAINISGRLLGIFLNAIYSIIMWMFAGIAIGRFLILSFLVGVLPLACVAYTTPWYKSKWDEWWKMFFTWNVNILILIPLILIGIALIATQGSFNEVKIQELFLNPVTTRPFGTLTGDAALIIAIVIRSIFIALYFCFVVVVALTWGGRAADYGYRFGKWLWGSVIGGALLWAGKEVAGKPVLDKLGSGLEKLGDTLARTPGWLGGPLRSLGTRVKDLGEGLRKPVKKDIEAQAKAIWEQIKDKSPEEIAQIIQRYPAALQKEIAKLAEKEKDEDELLQVAANLNLQQLAKTGVLKNLCGKKLRCQLTRLVTAQTIEERASALAGLVQELNWRTANLSHLNKVLTNAGVTKEEERRQLIANLLPDYISREASRSFWGNLQNLRELQNMGRGDIIRANIGRIAGSLSYRTAREGANEVAKQLGVNEQIVMDIFTTYFLQGTLDEKLQEWSTEEGFEKFLDEVNQRLASTQPQPKYSQEQIEKSQTALILVNHAVTSRPAEEVDSVVSLNAKDLAQVLGVPEDKIKNTIKNNINQLTQWVQNPEKFLETLGVQPATPTPQIPEVRQLEDEDKIKLRNLLSKLKGLIKVPPPGARERAELEALRRQVESLEARSTQQPTTTSQEGG
jgi:plasmid maintenance system antidote protein VapI/polyhydroxyalkanoate synthesis regulator phasin